MELARNINRTIKSNKNVFSIGIADIVLFFFTIIYPTFSIFCIFYAENEIQDVISKYIDIGIFNFLYILSIIFTPIIGGLFVLARQSLRLGDFAELVESKMGYDLWNRQGGFYNFMNDFIESNDMNQYYLSDSVITFIECMPACFIFIATIGSLLIDKIFNTNIIPVGDDVTLGSKIILLCWLWIFIYPPMAITRISERHKYHDIYEMLQGCNYNGLNNMSHNSKSSDKTDVQTDIIQPKIEDTVQPSKAEDILQYKGYTGSIIISDEEVLYGMVMGIRELISYEGHTVEELTSNFHKVIDDYIRLCEDR